MAADGAARAALQGQLTLEAKSGHRMTHGVKQEIVADAKLLPRRFDVGVDPRVFVPFLPTLCSSDRGDPKPLERREALTAPDFDFSKEQ